MDYCVVADLPTLVWLGIWPILNCILHFRARLKRSVPTVIAFDLDPGAPATIVQCCQVGLWVREIFGQFGLQAFAKTSGSKGLQIYVPLNTAVTYEQTKPFAKAIARLLEERHSDLVVSDMKKALRVSKIFVDWSQNDDYKTTVNVYSLRAKDQPTVSTPVTWKEVEECLKKTDPELLVFTSDQVLKRVEKSGDLFEPVLKLKQKLPPLTALGQGASQPDSAPAPKVKKAQSARPARKTVAKASSRKSRAR